jgi:VanZ family protein
MLEQPSPRSWYDTPLARWLAVALWMGVIFALSSRPDLPKAPGPWLDWLLKKGAHFTVYALLALLSWRALEWGGRMWPWAWLLAVLNPDSYELQQSFVSTRNPLSTDVRIDACGAAMALVLWIVFRRRDLHTG